MTAETLTPFVDTAVFFVVVLVIAVAAFRLVRRVGRFASGAHDTRGRDIAPAGGWSALAERFTAAAPPAAPVARGVTAMIGTTLWKNCVAVGAGRDGLALAVKVPILGTMGRPPLLIPWTEVAPCVPARLQWRAARLFQIGRPPLATLTVPEAVAVAIESARPGTAG